MELGLIRRTHALSARVRVVAAILLLNAFVLWLAGLSLHHSYGLLYQRAQIVSRNMSSLLADSIASQIDSIDASLLVIVDQARRERQLATGDGSYVDQVLRNADNRVPEVAGFRIIGADGHVVHSSGELAEASDVDLTDRDYFLTLRNGPDAGLVISPPLMGRVSKQWVIVLARRIDTPEGGFAGVAYTAMPVGGISTLFSHVDLRPGDAIAMRGPLPHLSVVARYPEATSLGEAVGNAAVSGKLEEMVAGNPERGTYLARPPIDGIERVLSYQRIAAYPFYVVVGLATDELHDQWLAESVQVIAIAIVFLVLTAAGGGFVLNSQRARRALQEGLRRKNEELERFAEILAHHMQEPVRQQHIFAQHLARHLPRPLAPEAQQSLDAIMAAARRHRALLSDAQTYLAFDSLAAAGPPEPGDLGLALALERLRDRLEAAGATVERLPLPPLPITPQALAEVFVALIDNAVTYATADQPPVIRVEGAAHHDQIVVSVTDNGVGIPAEFRERVFQVFERLDPHPGQTGTGIGLALARKIIEAAGGHIWIDQPDGPGTRVCFSLPPA